MQLAGIPDFATVYLLPSLKKNRDVAVLKQNIDNRLKNYLNFGFGPMQKSF
jgi:hypothetical protein